MKNKYIAKQTKKSKATSVSEKKNPELTYIKRRGYLHIGSRFPPYGNYVCNKSLCFSTVKYIFFTVQKKNFINTRYQL